MHTKVDHSIAKVVRDCIPACWSQMDPRKDTYDGKGCILGHQVKALRQHAQQKQRPGQRTHVVITTSSMTVFLTFHVPKLNRLNSLHAVATGLGSTASIAACDMRDGTTVHEAPNEPNESKLTRRSLPSRASLCACRDGGCTGPCSPRRMGRQYRVSTIKSYQCR